MPTSPSADRQPADPRLMAARLVAAVVDEGQMLSDLAASADAPTANPADRARAQRLALSTLRQLRRADTVLRPLLRRAPPPLVQALLQVATVEMLELGAPAHGVVNAAVAGTRQIRGGAALAGLVNAVLRRVAQMPQAEWAALPVPRLPGWLRRRLVAAYDADTVEALERLHLAGAPLDLTLRPLPPAERAALVETLGASELPGGTLRLATGAQVSELPGFAAGQWWVQDAAAALPAVLLAPRPGERVVDLCAAPGGKTMQLAAAGAQVVAVDLSQARLARLNANLARTGLAAEVVCADAMDWSPAAPVDAVLLDAPCSATGTIRRHPDLPLIRKPADVAALVALQARLMDRALGFLRPGGRLLYCTCSLLPDEGEEQIRAALDRHAGLRVLPATGLPFGAPTDEGGWRTLPVDLAEAGGVDGFYMALLQRG